MPHLAWTILRHWAELTLILAVLNMFQHCHNVADVIQIVQDPITSLGAVTATTIAFAGLTELLKMPAHALRLPILWRALVRWLKKWR